MTDPPLDLPAIKARVESIPPNGESSMKGMAFPATALPELWTLRHIAREDAPALLARAEAAEKAAAAVRELHKAKHGEKPVYASDDWHAEREPIEWVKYTICANCLSTYPCPTITALDVTE